MSTKKSNKSSIAKTQNEPATKSIQKIQEETKVNPATPPEQSAEESTQDMFDERWKFYLDDFIAKTKAAKVPITIAFIYDPILAAPIVWTNGHPWELAKAARDLHGAIMARVLAELSIDKGQRRD